MAEQPEDFIPAASSEQYSNFTKSLMYRDFQAEIDIRIEDLRNILELPEYLLKEKGDETHDMIRGAVKFARELKDVFETLRLQAVDYEETLKKEAEIEEDEHDSQS